MECRYLLLSMLFLVYMLQETSGRAIHQKEAHLSTSKRTAPTYNNNHRRVLALLSKIKQKTFARNLKTEKERETQPLKRNGEQEAEKEVVVMKGRRQGVLENILKKVLERSCSRDNSKLDVACRKRGRLFKKGWGNPSDIPWIN